MSICPSIRGLRTLATQPPGGLAARWRRLASWRRAWICALVVWTGPFFAQAAEPGLGPLSLADLSDTTNIHHQPQYCGFCHPTGTNAPFSFQVRPPASLGVNCRCHYNRPEDLRHPTDVTVPEEMRARLPASFPLADGKMTCVTCHSFAVLCAKEKPAVSSLRGAPYDDRTSFCFRCHDEKKYERLNPHRQRDAAGNVVEEKCLFCHTRKPDEARATYASIKLIGGVEMLCQGCHNVSELHPAGKKHMVRPTLEYQARMRQLEKQYGIVLPLDEKGGLTCITCHNPHEEGVIPSALPGAKGADQALRHRLPKVLCAECHWHPLSSPKR